MASVCKRERFVYDDAEEEIVKVKFEAIEKKIAQEKAVADKIAADKAMIEKIEADKIKAEL